MNADSDDDGFPDILPLLESDCSKRQRTEVSNPGRMSSSKSALYQQLQLMGQAEAGEFLQIFLEAAETYDHRDVQACEYISH